MSEIRGTIESAVPGSVVDEVTHAGETTLEIAPERLVEVARFVKGAPLSFVLLSDVNCADIIEDPRRFRVAYHLFSLESGTRLRLRCWAVPGAADAPELDSVTGVWATADWHEREVYDMFGVRFRNHPDLARILMPLDWDGHPLRRDYPLGGEEVQFTDAVAEGDAMSIETGSGLPVAEEAREALEAARREGRGLTDTERAIAGAEAMTPQEALATLEAATEADPGSRRPMVINLGPQHPSTHGVLRLVTELDGEVIRDIHPVIGYLHTGIEKQCENKTYWQAITLVTRMDYLASYFNIHAYTMSVERLLGLEVPDRAQYLRVIMCELNRITSHLVWLGTSGLELGALTVMFYTYREREKALDLGEMIAGERMNTRFFQVGGCSDDMPPGFEQRLRAFIAEMPSRIDEYEGLLSENPIWIDRTRGVGVLPADRLIDLGVTGPALRAAGVDLDLRKTAPYSGYEHFDFQVPLGATGDAYDRYAVRIREMRESVRIIGQALDGMPEGSHIADDRKVVLPPRGELATSMEALIHHFKLVTEGFRVPEGEAYTAVESPRGELGCYVVADGSPKPRRVHMRDPSFVNLQALRPMARGSYLADLITMIGSLDNVMGGVDR